MKSGPVFEGCVFKCCCSAVIGQRIVLLAASRMVVPMRNGSVLDSLMTMFAMPFWRFMSSYNNVDEGSYFVLWDEVYSETRRNPKKAVVMAAQSMSLSSYLLDEVNKLS